jgi:hypothetical protein
MPKPHVELEAAESNAAWIEYNRHRRWGQNEYQAVEAAVLKVLEMRADRERDMQEPCPNCGY